MRRQRQDRGPFLTELATVTAQYRDSHAARIEALGSLTMPAVPDRWRKEDLWSVIWSNYADPSGRLRPRAEAVAYHNPFDRAYVEAAILDFANAPRGKVREVHAKDLTALTESLASISGKIAKASGEGQRLRDALVAPVASFGPELHILPTMVHGQDADVFELIDQLEIAQSAVVAALDAANSLIEKRRVRTNAPNLYFAGSEASQLRLATRLAALWTAAGEDLSGGSWGAGFPAFLTAVGDAVDGPGTSTWAVDMLSAVRKTEFRLKSAGLAKSAENTSDFGGGL